MPHVQFSTVVVRNRSGPGYRWAVVAECVIVASGLTKTEDAAKQAASAATAVRRAWDAVAEWYAVPASKE